MTRSLVTKSRRRIDDARRSLHTNRIKPCECRGWIQKSVAPDRTLIKAALKVYPRPTRPMVGMTVLLAFCVSKFVNRYLLDCNGCYHFRSSYSIIVQWKVGKAYHGEQNVYSSSWGKYSQAVVHSPYPNIFVKRLFALFLSMPKVFCCIQPSLYDCLHTEKQWKCYSHPLCLFLSIPKQD